MSKVKRFFSDYRNAVADFTHNTKFMLASHALQNVGLGILTIVFGLYVVAQTGSDLTLGRAEAASSIGLALICLIATPLVTMTGYKRTLILGAVAYFVARFGQVAVPFALPIVLFGFINGLGEGINQASVVPFLSENSHERHRSHLFSADLFVRMGSIFVGNIIGGALPALLRLNLDQAHAYQITVAVAATFFALSLLPLLRIHSAKVSRKPRHAFRRYYAVVRRFSQWRHMGSLVIPQFTIALGAGITVPFISRYLQYNLQASDLAIGIVMGLSQLFVALFSLTGPFFKQRLGVRWSMVVIQAASLPLLIAIPWAPNILIVAPILWMRTSLMNMSWPLFNQYSMEGVVPREKPVIGASVAFSWAVGQIVGDLIGGRLMHARAGDYAYYITAAIYLVGIVFMAFMIKDSPKDRHTSTEVFKSQS